MKIFFALQFWKKYEFGLIFFFSFLQLESLLQLWLTLSLNSSSSGSKDSGADIFLYNANRIPVISLNQGKIREIGEIHFQEG